MQTSNIIKPATATIEENDFLETSLEYVELVMKHGFADADDVLKATRKTIQHYIDKGAKLLGYGRTRIVFVNDENTVVKIAFTWEGMMASSSEVRTFKGYSESPTDYIPMAKCYFEDIDTENGEISVLIMENVEPCKVDYDAMPQWVGSVDCGQVGYNTQGELVAYDL